MATEPKPTPYEARLKSLLSEPDLIDRVFATIANGGDLVSLAESMDIRYNDLAEWINRDIERSKKFTAACALGDEWARKRLLKELKRIALIDIRDAYDTHGRLLPIKKLPPELASAIASVETDELYEGYGKDKERIGDVKKIKFWPKIEALRELGKELGMFTPKLKIEGRLSLEDLVAGSNEHGGEDNAKTA